MRQKTILENATKCRTPLKRVYAVNSGNMIKTIQLLVVLRWIAIVCQMGAIVFAYALHLPVKMGLFIFALGIQMVVNLVTHAGLGHPADVDRWKEWPIFFQLIFDLISLNLFMIASGGLANPLSGLFLIQAVVAAMLLSGKRLIFIIAATGFSYSVLTFTGDPSHHHHSQWMAFHIPGMVVNHILTTAVVGYFVYQIIRNLKSKERQLSAQQSLVGAGATAAQIAHKLGTPLNMIALINDDLTDKNLEKSRQMMADQLSKCKHYLSIFFSRLHRLDGNAESRSLSESLGLSFTENTIIRFRHRVENDQIISAMSAELLLLLVEIMVENAVDAGATEVEFTAKFTPSELQVLIQNDGAPLPDELRVLMKLGYSKDKGIHHSGI
ncbi:sensor histidine kinase, partial [bacterium]|nr:sensor histidine kinase [bacterium]